MSFSVPYEMEQAIDLSVRRPPSVDLQESQALDYSPPRTTSPHGYGYHISPYHFPYQHPYQHPYQQYHTLSPPQRVPGENALPQTSPSLSTGSSGDRLIQPPRPFKVVTSALPEQSVVDLDPSYAAFRDSMLEAMRARNGGSLTVSNPRMRRSVRRPSHIEHDMDYLQRRARNNAAAKRSRDIRKQKEDELAIRAAFLQNKIRKLQTAEPSACIQCGMTGS